MRERGTVRVMGQLAAVQRARKVAAEAALHAARSAEDEARQEEGQALDRATAAQQDWSDHIARSGFSPEYSRSLSGIVIDCEQQASKASVQVQLAAKLSDTRRSDWQTQEAKVRLSEASYKRVKRRFERQCEEDRLNAVADRVTFLWSVP